RSDTFRTMRRIHTFCLSAAVLFAPLPAAAQTPAAPSVEDQVEVVATRWPEAPHEVPASIEVIDGDSLRATGATTLREALALAAGVDGGPGGGLLARGSVPAH